MMRRLFAAALILSLPAIASAGEIQSAAAVGSAPAKLSELAWLEGVWEGPGINGGRATEVYSAPAGGQIVGHFRQLKADGTVLFYELVSIVQVDDTLQYRLKHFNADLTGWEEKAVVKTFPLTATQSSRWVFGGLTLERTGANAMRARVKVKQADGSVQDLSFPYRRK